MIKGSAVFSAGMIMGSAVFFVGMIKGFACEHHQRVRGSREISNLSHANRGEGSRKSKDELALLKIT